MNAYAVAANLITKTRDYKREYKNYHGKPEQIKARASRNAARRKLAKEGRVKPGDGKDIDHIDHDPMNNDSKNLRVRDMSHNRADNKHKSYRTAANLLAIVQRAGARHSAKDNAMVQEMHDRACELGAKCKCEGMGHPMLKGALVLRHPGHGNQKVHGNRFGGYGTTKESLRRLKDDKGARERYKTAARGRAAATAEKEAKKPYWQKDMEKQARDRKQAEERGREKLVQAGMDKLGVSRKTISDYSKAMEAAGMGDSVISTAQALQALQAGGLDKWLSGFGADTVMTVEYAPKLREYFEKNKVKQ